MYAQVTRVQLQKNGLHESDQVWQQTLLPALQKQTGFKGVLVLNQHDTDRGMAIVLWDTQADAQRAHMTDTMQAAFRQVGRLFAVEPVREWYEVAVDQRI